MPKIPEGAKTPSDRKKSENVKPPKRPEGWELLRDPMDIDYSEHAEFVSVLAGITMRGSQVALTTKNLKSIGALAGLLQTQFANESTAFRAWMKELPFAEATGRLIPLVYEYADALGEAPSSAT